MSTEDAITHIESALASTKPACFAQVSPQALAVLLAVVREAQQ